jgi:hypothetical protein
MLIRQIHLHLQRKAVTSSRSPPNFLNPPRSKGLFTFSEAMARGCRVSSGSSLFWPCLALERFGQCRCTLTGTTIRQFETKSSQARYKYRSGEPKQEKPPMPIHVRLPVTPLEVQRSPQESSSDVTGNLHIGVFYCLNTPDLHLWQP